MHLYNFLFWFYYFLERAKESTVLLLKRAVQIAQMTENENKPSASSNDIESEENLSNDDEENVPLGQIRQKLKGWILK